MASPLISLVRNLPVPCEPSATVKVPFIFVAPFTSSFDPGVFVQIPTLPVAVTLIL